MWVASLPHDPSDTHVNHTTAGQPHDTGRPGRRRAFSDLYDHVVDDLRARFRPESPEEATVLVDGIEPGLNLAMTEEPEAGLPQPTGEVLLSLEI
ncbi:MAG: hypothetical protein ACRDXF_01230 [Acidimicrobiia bacterium]